MAKTDNLKDFLTDVADAIREKTGTTEPINPQDFSDTIKNIQSGGEGGSIPSLPIKDVVFYDYDGLVLYSFTKEEFLALTTMPELPKRTGLTCQGWNWEFSEAHDYVERNGGCDIGAIHITEDGKTRFYINLDQPNNYQLTIKYTQSATNGVVVDFGDGSPKESYEGTGAITVSHKYANPGYYCIEFGVVDGTMTINNTLFSTANDRAMVWKIELGDRVKLTDYVFQNLKNLDTINIPISQYITTIPRDLTTSISKLKALVFPMGITKYADTNYDVTGQAKIDVLCLPQDMAHAGTRLCYNNTRLSRIVIPRAIKKINSYMLSNCSLLKRIILHDEITEIGAYQGIAYCSSLLSLYIPASVQTIGQEVFNNNKAMIYYDFSSHKAIPTLASSNTFSNMPSTCKIVVPDALYDDWIVATNWSARASNIIKKTDWDAQNS